MAVGKTPIEGGSANDFLPYGRQDVDAADLAAVAAVLQSDWLTGGPVVDRFEEAFAARMGAGFAVACSSGTAALHMAAAALGLGPGDAAIVPAITFLATANAARFVGAEVIFADVDPETGLMGPADLERGLDEARRRGLDVRVAIPVHYAGQAVDMAGLHDALGRAGAAHVSLVEDACHAVGTEFSRPSGVVRVGDCAMSRMTVFSLHPVKTITMGEGGVVTTNDAGLDLRLRHFRNHGMVREAASFVDPALALDPAGAPNPWYYEMQDLGYNYRASAIHCALGLSQLGKLDAFVARRRELVRHYDRLLAPLAPLVRPLARQEGCDPAWHLYAVQIDFASAGTHRAAVMRALAGRGIGTQVHYMPLHLQPYYKARYGHQSLTGSEAFYGRTLSLPLFPAMADGDVERVVAALGDVLAR